MGNDNDDQDIDMESHKQPQNDQENEDEDDDDYIDYEPKATLTRTRARRNTNKPKISYKDDSSSEEEEESESDDDNPLFVGLSKKEKKELRAKMDSMQSSYTDSVQKERALKLEEIICSFDFNIGEKVTLTEAGFIYDFCNKHQFDVFDKIEEEGDFFLMSMREMIDE